MSISRFLTAGGALALLGLGISNAKAQDFVVDQEAVPPTINSGYSIADNAPIGQEFVPQSSSLNVVELLVNTTAPMAIQVRIRAGSILGQIVGTSSDAAISALPPPENSLAHFEFPSAVSLMPGELYVIEVFVVSGAGYAYISGYFGGTDVYPPGRAIIAGVPEIFGEFWFREGSGSPVGAEPATWGRLKHMLGSQLPAKGETRVPGSE
jgi:hypothetical protein